MSKNNQDPDAILRTLYKRGVIGDTREWYRELSKLPKGNGGRGSPHSKVKRAIKNTCGLN